MECKQVPDKTRLPVGVSSFAAIRKRGRVYVDKTAQILDLINSGDFVFLSRPRRFGKSLLVSTLAELFSRGLENFTGLKIEKLWHEGTYPVVQLDFSLVKNCNTYEEFLNRFDFCLKDAIDSAGLETASAPGDPIERWAHFLRTRKESEIVVLIDEYDSPLTTHLHDEEFFHTIRSVMASFFDATKAHNGKLRFLLLTGVLKYRQASLFSSFNNIVDVSLWPEFGTILGLTQDELSEYFGDYVSHAAHVLGSTTEDVVQKLILHYDGYCFDRNAGSRVFAPWSVLSFLKEPQHGFRNYWFGSAGTTALLANYLKQHDLLKPEDFDRELKVRVEELENADRLHDIKPEVLLTHAGYLSIQKADGNILTLQYPNWEVRDSMAELFAAQFWSSEFDHNSIARWFVKALEEKNKEEILNALNAVIHFFNYQNFPLANESAVQHMMLVFCLGATLGAQLEVHSPKGRSDLEVRLKNTDVVFELKYARKTDNPEDLLQKALTQLVEKDYGKAMYGRTLLRIGLVFSEDQRKFCSIGFV